VTPLEVVENDGVPGVTKEENVAWAKNGIEAHGSKDKGPTQKNGRCHELNLRYDSL
jgi:hypothetical protein